MRKMKMIGSMEAIDDEGEEEQRVFIMEPKGRLL